MVGLLQESNTADVAQEAHSAVSEQRAQWGSDAPWCVAPGREILFKRQIS